MNFLRLRRGLGLPSAIEEGQCADHQRADHTADGGNDDSDVRLFLPLVGGGGRERGPNEGLNKGFRQWSEGR